MKMRSFVMLSTLVILISCKKDDKSSSAISPAVVSNALISGSWRITNYYDKDHSETASFNGYNFTFNTSGIVTATRSGVPVNGTWSSGNDDSTIKLILTFSSPEDFSEISDDWKVVDRTDTKISLQDISGGGGGTELLTFEKN